MLIGGADDGAILGIARISPPSEEALDKFEPQLTNLLGNDSGQAFKAAKIAVSFPRLGWATICRIDIQCSRTAHARGSFAPTPVVQRRNR